MKKPWRWTLILGSVAIAAVVGYVSLYVVAVWWQVHQVEQVCNEMHPGTPVAKIRQAIEKRGLWNSLVSYQFDHEGGKGYYREESKTWEYAVPAAMTYGDTVCFISHDGSVVVHTEVLY